MAAPSSFIGIGIGVAVAVRLRASARARTVKDLLSSIFRAFYLAERMFEKWKWMWKRKGRGMGICVGWLMSLFD